MQRTPAPTRAYRAYLNVICRATSGAVPPPPPSSTGARSRRQPPSDFERLTSRLEDLRGLAQEAAEIAFATGPRAVSRTAQAAEAFLTVGRTQLNRLQTSSQPDPPAVVLRQLFERLGATYIKLGQFIASSPTIFPAEFVEEFQKCLDSAPPVDFSIVRRTIESELGMALEDVFESVDSKPLATASIAQVHSAVLRGSRQEVVIKVLKPGVEDTLTTDLNFLYLASRALEVAAPDLSRVSLSAVASDIRASMLQEVDFRQEAIHLEHFASYLDSTGLRSVATCPQLYKQYCTRRVLVMERLKGASLTDLDAVRRASNANAEQVLLNALNVWLGSVVGAETFHADVHAGNLLVLPDGRVGFIDFGIVGEISQPTWRAMEALLRAVGQEDYDTAARALATIGVTDGDVDVDAFAADLKELAASLQAIDADLVVAAGAGGVSAQVVADENLVNKFLIELVRVGEDNGVKFPREFALLLKQILYFDRYTRLLAPAMDVLSDDRVRLGTADWDVGPGEYRAL